MSKLILNVIHGKKTNRIPIWIMRQAGRYLPQYQALRKKYDILTLFLTPELAAEVTLQPVKILDVDAAIIFSDILIPCLSMGCKLKFIEGIGPVISTPIRSLEDIKSLKIPYQSEETKNVSEAIKIVKKKLSQDKALIGFCAAPFTLACYLVEGKASKNFLHIKTLIYNQPKAFHLLMEKISQILINYLRIQAESGAEILQIFDTWGGILSPADFTKFSRPYLEKLVSEFKKEFKQPLIYFMRGNGGFLHFLKDLPVEVMAIDWTINLLDASRCVENRFILQGNLDPAVLFSSKKIIKEKTEEILLQGKKVKGHIFNLGHGILPSTPMQNARYLVDVVHNYILK